MSKKIGIKGLKEEFSSFVAFPKALHQFVVCQRHANNNFRKPPVHLGLIDDLRRRPVSA